MLKSVIDTQRNIFSKSYGMEGASSPDCRKAHYRPAQSTIERLRRVEAADRASLAYATRVPEGYRPQHISPPHCVAGYCAIFSAETVNWITQAAFCRRHHAVFPASTRSGRARSHHAAR